MLRLSTLLCVLVVLAQSSPTLAAQDEQSLRALQRETLVKALEQAETLLRNEPAGPMRTELERQLILPLSLASPMKALELVRAMPEPMRPHFMPIALAGSILQDPTGEVSSDIGEQARGALIAAARYIAAESPDAALAFANNQTTLWREDLVRASVAVTVARTDTADALSACLGIEDQGLRERTLLRIAENRASTLTPAEWQEIMGHCYGRGSRAGLHALRALSLAASAPAEARQAADEVLAEWRRLYPDSHVPAVSSRAVVSAVTSLRPDAAASLAPLLAARVARQWGEGVEALALLGRVAPDAVRAEVSRILAEPASQHDGSKWLRAHLLGVGVGLGDEAALAEAADAGQDVRGSILITAALVSPEAAARFGRDRWGSEDRWLLAGTAAHIARIDPAGAVTIARMLPGQRGERAHAACSVLQVVAERDPDLAMRELPTILADAGPDAGLPLGAILRVAAQAKLAAGAALVPGIGLDLPLDISTLNMNQATRASALAGMAVAMAPYYRDNARTVMLEALRLAESMTQEGQPPWALVSIVPELGRVDPEAALSIAMGSPAEPASPEWPSVRLSVLVALARTLANALGWSEELHGEP